MQPGTPAWRASRLPSHSSSTLTTVFADALQLLRLPLEREPALGFSYGRMRFFGDWEGVLRFPPYDPYALLYRHTIGLSALMRREVIEDTGGFDEDFLYFEDWELWLDALEHGWRGLQVDAVTVEYRKHGGSRSARTGALPARLPALEAKHAALYARAPELAGESPLGPSGGSFIALLGPAASACPLEQALYRLYFSPRERRRTRANLAARIAYVQAVTVSA